MTRAVRRLLAISLPLALAPTLMAFHGPSSPSGARITELRGPAVMSSRPLPLRSDPAGSRPEAETTLDSPGDAPTNAVNAVPLLEATVPKVTWSKSELFTEIAAIKGADAPDFHATAFWYNGYMGIVFSQGEQEGGIAMFDLSNPRAPKLVGMGRDSRQREGHTTGFIHTAAGVLAVSLASNGINLWNLNDPTKPTLYSNIELPGVQASDYDFGAWWVAVQAPYIYFAGGFNGLYVIDISDLSNPKVANQVSLGSGFRAGPVYAVGNLLTQSISDGAQTRIYDISDPINPTLFTEYAQFDRSYAVRFNGGYLYCAMKVGGLEIIDLHDPAQPYTVSTTSAKGAGAYVMVQDNLVNIGNSDAFYQFNATDPFHPFIVGSAAMVSSRSTDNDFVSSLGNMVMLSDDEHTGTDNNGTRIIPVYTSPDNTPPEVNFVSPGSGDDWVLATARVGVTLTDQLLVSSVTSETFVVQTADGLPVPGTLSIQHDTVNFTPDVPLEVDQEYELILPAGGIADVSGNRLAQEYRSTFTTGPELVNPPHADAGGNKLAYINEPALLEAGRTTGGVGSLEYSWDPGDGTPATPFTNQPQVAHTYTTSTHRTAIVTVRDSRGQTSRADCIVSVVNRPLATPPTWSATIAFDEIDYRVWTVNPDANTVAVIDADKLTLQKEIPVGLHPTTLAIMDGDTVWVANQDSAEVSMIDAVTLQERDRIALPAGSRPYGIVADPTLNAVYVSLEGPGQVLALDPVSGLALWSSDVGPTPRGLAVVNGSLFVSRFISPADHAEVLQLDPHTGAVVKLWTLADDPGPDSEISSRGIPNYLSQLVPSWDGKRLFVPAVKQNTDRGLYRDGNPMTFENTNRAILSTLDLSGGSEDLSARIDYDNRDQVSALAQNQEGDYGFLAFQGDQSVVAVDLLNGQEVASILHVGHAPQGLLVTPDKRLFIQNFLGRDVTVYDVATMRTASSIVRLADIRTVAVDPLSPQVLLGKRIFYNSSDRRMSKDSYISCAGCHLDGGSDRRVWDFTDRGEGLRKTINMRGRAGMLHGPVHWSANFDEIQDFENDIRNAFLGKGFMSDAEFATGTRSQGLGDAKAGVSPELDAMAAYVATLYHADESPYRGTNGALTAAAKRGRDLFRSSTVGCATCHAGPNFTDSVLTADRTQFILHDVGTLTAASGKRMGQPLTGLDTPSLKGVWNDAPFLHDGSAPTLRDVLRTRNTADKHGRTSQLTADQLNDLEAYLRSIDGRSGSPVVMRMTPTAGQQLQSTKQISLDFSAWPDPATVTASSIQVLLGTTVVAGTLKTDRDRVTFTPGTALKSGTYTVKVSSSLLSLDGDAATAWSGAFTLATLPLVQNLKVYTTHASAYSLQTKLRAGVMPFGDRDDKFIYVSRKYAGLGYLRMASHDDQESRPAMLSFDLTAPARVYVAFDRTMSSLPGWAADFVPTGDIVATPGEYSPMYVYVANLPAGNVVLGGPRCDGGQFNKVNYFLFFEPLP